MKNLLLSLLLLTTNFVGSTQNVGIGTNSPVNRLDIQGINAWDLTNTEGDVRIGNPNYRLKIGVALSGGGAGATNIMQVGGIGVLSIGANNKYMVQLNGSSGFIDLMNNSGGLRINGNAGIAGQFLRSNGVAAPSWENVSVNNNSYTNTIAINGSTSMQTTSTLWQDIPGLTYTLNATGNTKILLSYNIAGYSAGCTNCGSSIAYIGFVLNNNIIGTHTHAILYDESKTFTGTHLFDLPVGSHTIKLQGIRTNSASGNGIPFVRFGSAPGFAITNIILQIIQQ